LFSELVLTLKMESAYIGEMTEVENVVRKKIENLEDKLYISCEYERREQQSKGEEGYYCCYYYYYYYYYYFCSLHIHTTIRRLNSLL
jgi:hypothetical protein